MLDVLVADDSAGLHPRFVSLQVDSDEDIYFVKLYDIDYTTWDVRCIWQGSRLRAFGVLGDSIFCSSSEGWMLLDARSGRISREVPFEPLEAHGDFWLIRKAGETDGRWSLHRGTQQLIAHFGPVDPGNHFIVQDSVLATDGRSLAWLQASSTMSSTDEMIPGLLILQADGRNADIRVPVELHGHSGSSMRVILNGARLSLLPEGAVQLRTWKGEGATEERVWTIDIATGEVSSRIAPHSPAEDAGAGTVDGVPVPEYLRAHVKGLEHFGRGALAPAFLLHLGLLEERPEYFRCTTGASRDGRHVLYCAKKGPLAGEYIYGDLLTQQVVRWRAPAGLEHRAAQEFVWIEAAE